MKMAEPKTSCLRCGVTFLQSTADCTDGLCMPCFKGVSVARKMRGKVDPLDNDEKISKSEWIKAGIFGVIIIGLLLIIKPLISLLVCFLFHFLFGVSWSNSIITGFVTYLVLGVISDIADVERDRKGSKKNEGIQEKMGREAQKGFENRTISWASHDEI